jgi:hypothetical protein
MVPVQRTSVISHHMHMPHSGVFCVKYWMRILVTLPSHSGIQESIHQYCQAHAIHMNTQQWLTPDGSYMLWRISCEPSKYVDLLLLTYSDWLAVY